MYLKKGHKSFFYKSNNRTMSSYYKFYTIVSEKVNLLLIMHKQKVKKTLQWYVYLFCRLFFLLLFLFYWAFLFAHYNSLFANSIATVSMKRFWLPWRTPTKEYIYQNYWLAIFTGTIFTERMHESAIFLFIWQMFTGSSAFYILLFTRKEKLESLLHFLI